MKKGIVIIISIFWFSTINAQQKTIKNLTATEFKDSIAKNNGTLLDVRTSYEFENAHIKNAKQLNYYSWGFKDDILQLPKNKLVYVYCKSGYRSKKAAQILLKNGYTVFNLEHGITEWLQKNFPTTQNTD